MIRACLAYVVGAGWASKASWWWSYRNYCACWLIWSTSGCVRECLFDGICAVYLLGYSHRIYEDLLHLSGVVLCFGQLFVARLAVSSWFAGASTVLEWLKEVWVISLDMCGLLDGKPLIILESSSALVHDDSVGAWSFEDLVPWRYVVDPGSFRLFPKVEPLVVVLVQGNAAAEHDVGQVFLMVSLPRFEVDDVVEVRWWSCSSAVRLQDRHSNIADVQVVHYCSLDLGISEVNLSALV